MTEEWRDIKGYEGLYQVSNLGRVKSFNIWNGHKYIYGERILKPTLRKVTSKYYFYSISLRKNNQSKHFRVHRLVAMAFIPNSQNKKEVNHIDSNPLNNNVVNLEWVTRMENVIHANRDYRTRIINPKYYQKICELYQSKLNIKQLARKYNVSDNVIKKILEENNIKLKSGYEANSVYGIDRNNMINMFKSGFRNKDIIEELGGNRCLIATYKYKWKRGELS